jgi:hypothetical protein
VKVTVRASLRLAITGAALVTAAACPAQAASSWSSHVTLTPLRGDRMAHGDPVTRSTGNATAAPGVNIPASPDYEDACWDGGSVSGRRSARCRSQALAAINHAHAVEHIPPVHLPRRYWSLGVRRQLFVITNAERVSRGLPPVQGLTRQANSWAAAGARRNADPHPHGWRLWNGARIRAWASNWAADYNSLTADYSWMYLDGWAGSRAATSNLDCTSPHAAGCWGHRRNILVAFPRGESIIGGAGFVVRGWDGYYTSYAQLFVAYSGRRPAFTYTWSQATRSEAR